MLCIFKQSPSSYINVCGVTISAIYIQCYDKGFSFDNVVFFLKLNSSCGTDIFIELIHTFTYQNCRDIEGNTRTFQVSFPEEEWINTYKTLQNKTERVRATTSNLHSKETRVENRERLYTPNSRVLFIVVQVYPTE